MLAGKTKLGKALGFLIATILFTAIASSRTIFYGNDTPNGTNITNRADGTYEGGDGTTYNTSSETITFSVLSVASLTVGPKETVPSASIGPQQRITRLFRICNTGNVTTSYTIVEGDVTSPSKLVNFSFDNDSTGTVSSDDTLIEIGSTPSALVAPGVCLGVLALVDTLDIPADSLLRIHLKVRSNATATANGRAEDDGTIINSVGRGPQLTNPTSAALPPLKTVNDHSQSIVTRGNPFTYSIAFRNSGDVPARNLILTDELPAEIDYVAGSLRLENPGFKELSDAQDTDEGYVRGRHIEVRLAEVAPEQVVRVTFKAQLGNDALSATAITNVAQLFADNVAVSKTNSAVVLADPFGTVFSGRGGAGSPVPGARVSLSNDLTLTSLLQLQAGNGFPPNIENINPLLTDYLGHFSFRLSDQQVAGGSSSSKYYIRVTAQGFNPRLIETTLRAGEPGLFSLTQRALDGQPLAIGGGFTLVQEDVTVDNLADIAFNIPLFEEHGLEITKIADQPRAEIGDVVTYHIEVRNPTATLVNNVTVRDDLPESFHYVPGTARLVVGSTPEQIIEPQTVGEDLLFSIGAIPPGASARLLYRVRIGANAQPGDRENVAVGSGVFPSGERNSTGAARASVRVGGGVFSSQQVIIGRVYDDVNRNGSFDSNDEPLPGVRLYLTSGQSVITDSQGLYNFPSLGDGSMVIALDPITVPAGYLLQDGGSVAGRSWTRLLRTPIGGGSLLRQNFALVRSAISNATIAATVDKASEAEPSTTRKTNAQSFGAPQNSSSADKQNSSITPAAAGTYEFVTDEKIDPIAPGTVKVLSPAADAVVMRPALEVSARVALKWTVKLEVNGEKVSDKNIGTTRFDQKNSVATFTYVSIGLRPGPNRVRATPISPDGIAGQSEELIVQGRGPAQRLEIVPEKTAIHAGGRDSTIVKIHAMDKWGHPANDSQIAIESSLGQLVRLDQQPADDGSIILPGKVVAHADLSLQSQYRDVKESVGDLIVPMENGEASVRLIGPGQVGEARLHVVAGKLEAESKIRILPEVRSRILLGLAEVSFGNSIPEVGLRGEQGTSRNRISLFYSGPLFAQSSLMLSYDSQRPINRTGGRNRVFELDPLDRAYPLFGDSSTRFEAAQSNSKLYARVDHKRSYGMFGDLDADMSDVPLAGYTRKLTGVKIHLENSGNDFVTVTGARPDTSFARDVFPAGGLSIIKLAFAEILQGSETVVVEVRDRRNPEIVLSREFLARSIDYNLDPTTGELLLLRVIPTFDSGLNLKQIVVTYEHQANGMGSSVYTARGRKNFDGLGMKLGFSTILQRQDTNSSFIVGGLDLEKSLPRRGLLRLAWATTRGELSNSVNGSVVDDSDSAHDGNAFSVDLQQPLNFAEAIVHARFASASAGFLNPFGATVTPGSRRAEVSLDFKPRQGAVLRFGLSKEDNHTANVDNKRLTLSVAGEQIIKERIRLQFGYDHRNFTDDLSQQTTNSDLVTVGAQVQVTDKLELAVKREQNIGEADPSYPNQTTLSATYKVNLWTNIFLTQRLASAAILPIGDFSQTGFASTSARRETALGVESRFGKYTSVVGRYQMENGISGADSFAVIGLQNRLPVTKEVALELGFERGFHLAGNGQSFNSATLGFRWTPNDNFKANARYEFRDRGGSGQMLAIGAAGQLSEGVTVLSRMRWSQTSFAGRDASSIDGLAALAIRPLKSDRAGLLFSFNHRSVQQSVLDGAPATRDRLNTAAADGYYQATKRLELYGRFALRFAANGREDLPFASTLTYLSQARVQYRLTTRLDWAAEARFVLQPSSQTQRSIYGTEIGFWALPDLRLGLGYNFNAANEPDGASPIPTRRGVYFAVSSKLSSLFDLFGTSKEKLQSANNQTEPTKEP